MKILVTGITLSSNLGSAAMALTFSEEIRKRYGKNIELVYAVIGNKYDSEKKWAEYYGFKIVRRDYLTIFLLNKFKLLPFFRYIYINDIRISHVFKTNSFWKDVHKEFIDAYEKSDLVIDLSGISYVGDGTRKYGEALKSYTYYFYAKKTKRKFIRFIQSFGPFKNKLVRFFAKRELNNLDIIFARGKQSAEFCKKIVNNPQKVHCFPDSAILLPKAKQIWVDNYLKSKELVHGKYVVLTPSSVVYHISNNKNGVFNEHINVFVEISRFLIKNNYKILFLPHTYSVYESEDDRTICEIVLSKLSALDICESHVKLVEEDIDPIQAKGLIASSRISIVSRYHALVAAASTSTPVIALGWNVKYEDFLDYYDLKEMAIDVRNRTSSEVFEKVKECFHRYIHDNTLVDKITRMNVENKIKVNNAFNILSKWIDKSIK